MRERIKSVTYVCSHCKMEYHPKERSRNKYCSRECAFASRVKKPKEKTDHVCKCGICGKEFLGRSSKKYCSDECRLERARVRYVDYYKKNKAAAVINDSVKKLCKWCAKEFETNFMAGKREYCSAECSRKAEKLQYRSRKRGHNYIEPVMARDVILRDGCQCGICGEDIDMALPAFDMMALTIDHIIPLSKGGEHSMNNVQLAHRRCNSNKGNSMDERVWKHHPYPPKIL